MRIGIQKTFIDSGSFALGIAPDSGGILSSSIIDCSDWNSATIYVSCSSASPTSQIEARSFISPVVSGAFYAVTGSGQQEQSTVGLTDAFSFSIDLAGARRFYVEFEEVGDPTTATQVTGSTIISHERGMRETVISSSVSGLTNPMTTAGDMIFNNLSSEEDRIAIGNEADVLTVVGGVPAWQAPVPSSGSIDTSLQAAPDTGWTAAGDGTASIDAGVVALSNTASTTAARLHRALPESSPHGPMVEVSCRCTLVTNAGVIWQGLGITNGDFTRGVQIALSSSYYAARYNTAGTWVDAEVVGHGGTALWIAGEVWLRIVFGPAHAHLFYGTGATRPTSWTRLRTFYVGLTAPDFAAALADGLTDVVVFATRGGAGGADETEASDIQWRSLLGAPT